MKIESEGELRERGDKVLQLVAAFQMGMEELGMEFAMVTLDAERQTADSALLGYAGSVGTDAGARLFLVWLEMMSSATAEVKYRGVVRTLTEAVQ